MPGPLQTRLIADMKAAMKAGEKDKLTLIRLLINDLKNGAEGKPDGLSEEQEIAILRGSEKQRREAIEQADEVGRSDIADGERAELAIIVQYLPQLMDEQEVEAKASALIAELGISEPKEKGLFMKEWMSRYRATSDGKTVQKVLGRLLS